jgi:hypothetical protein
MRKSILDCELRIAKWRRFKIRNSQSEIKKLSGRESVSAEMGSRSVFQAGVRLVGDAWREGGVNQAWWETENTVG